MSLFRKKTVYPDGFLNWENKLKDIRNILNADDTISLRHFKFVGKCFYSNVGFYYEYKGRYIIVEWSGYFEDCHKISFSNVCASQDLPEFFDNDVYDDAKCVREVGKITVDVVKRLDWDLESRISNYKGDVFMGNLLDLDEVYSLFREILIY
jgi:hypothetical protein